TSTTRSIISEQLLFHVVLGMLSVHYAHNYSLGGVVGNVPFQIIYLCHPCWGRSLVINGYSKCHKNCAHLSSPLLPASAVGKFRWCIPCSANTAQPSSSP